MEINIESLDTNQYSKIHITDGIAVANNSSLIRNNTAQMENDGSEKRATFICDHCNYNCNKKTNYLRHLTSEKHKKNVNKIVKCNVCEHCNKEFTTQSGLWKHRKKCVIVENNTVDKRTVHENKSSITNNIPMELILEVIKQSKEIQTVLVEQNKELQAKLLEQGEKLLEKENLVIDQQKQMIEMAKKPSMVNSNNNSNNNNHFNLNFFLNETCKNAMNIQDFIHSIKLTTQDFETTGRIGFVDGISRIFINELKRLEVERRPLHCTDIKRETVYVKDNDTWEKENLEKKKLKWAINSIAQLNLNQVQDWQQEYPECRENNTLANTHFNKMAMVALGGFGDVEETKFRDKIVKNVLKEIIIDKET